MTIISSTTVYRAILLGASALSFLGTANGHHPHDVIQASAVSNEFAGERHIFVSSPGSFNLFLQSTDSGGTWRERRRGLRQAQVLDVAISPAYETDQTVFALTSQGLPETGFAGGLHRSTNRGQSWEPPPHEARGVAMAISPTFSSDGTLFYAETSTLYRSRDRGVTDEVIQSVEPDRYLRVEVSRSFAQDQVVAVVLNRSGIALSEDAGDTWNIATSDLTSPFEPSSVRAVAISPEFSTDATLWAATEETGVWVSHNKGVTWSAINSGLGELFVMDLAVSPGYPHDRYIYCTTPTAGLYLTTNSGESWSRCPLNISFTDQTDQHYQDLLLPSDFVQTRTLYVEAYEGFFHSDDAGTSWIQSHLNPTRMGRALAYLPAESERQRVIASGYGQALLWTEDAGDEWSLRGNGMRTTSVYSLAASPNYDSDPVIICGIGGGIRRTTDHGQTWTQHPLEKFQGEGSGVIREIAFAHDFSASRTIWSLAGAGLYRSQDSGITWTASPSPVGQPTGFAMSPNFASDSTFFASGRLPEAGVVRSTDAGRTWYRCAPLDQEVAKDVVLSPNYGISDARVYAALARGLVMVSLDGGDTWHPTETPLPSHPRSLSTAVDESGAVLLLVGTAGEGILATHDDGASWTQFGGPYKGMNTVHRVWASPNYRTDGLVFAGTFDGFYRTQDRGLNWKLTTVWERYDDKRGEPLIIETASGQAHHKFVPGAFNSTESIIWKPGDRFVLDFDGIGVRWLGAQGPDMGIASLVLDGAAPKRIDLYAAQWESQANCFEVSDLSRGLHTLEIHATGEQNPLSGFPAVAVDAIDVLIIDKYQGIRIED